MNKDRLREVLGKRYEDCNSGHTSPNYSEGICTHCYRELKPAFLYHIENNPGLAIESKREQQEIDWAKGLRGLEKELKSDEVNLDSRPAVA